MIFCNSLPKNHQNTSETTRERIALTCKFSRQFRIVYYINDYARHIHLNCANQTECLERRENETGALNLKDQRSHNETGY